MVKLKKMIVPIMFQQDTLLKLYKKIFKKYWEMKYK